MHVSITSAGLYGGERRGLHVEHTAGRRGGERAGRGGGVARVVAEDGYDLLQLSLVGANRGVLERRGRVRELALGDHAGGLGGRSGLLFLFLARLHRGRARVEAETALERANANLEERVGERTATLTRVNSELESARKKADAANRDARRMAA